MDFLFQGVFTASFPSYLSDFIGMSQQTAYELNDQISHFKDYLSASQEEGQDEVELPEDKFVDAFPFLPPTPSSGIHADPTPEPLAPLEPVLGIEILLDENRDPKSYKINGTEILRPPATLMPISPKEMSNKTKFAPSPSPAPTRVGNMVRNLERRSLKVPVLARDDADDEWLPLPEDGNGPERTSQELTLMIKAIDQSSQNSQGPPSPSLNSTNALPARSHSPSSGRTLAPSLAASTRTPIRRLNASLIRPVALSPRRHSQRTAPKIITGDQNQLIPSSPSLKIKTELMAARATPSARHTPRETLANRNTDSSLNTSPMAHPQRPVARQLSLSLVTRDTSVPYQSPSPTTTPSPTSNSFSRATSTSISTTNSSSYPSSSSRSLQKRSKRRKPKEDGAYESKPIKRRRTTKKTETSESAKLPIYCLYKGCKKGLQSSATPKDRDRHMDTHFTPRYVCSECNIRFSRRISVQQTYEERRMRGRGYRQSIGMVHVLAGRVNGTSETRPLVSTVLGMDGR
ncbi:hypothetical protein QCA50_008629 [Cerrena zonata]|uniref:C2H2-type domain-containing protein n=1 Tax=Cerrena zonata TaxID=2478898 RepID=A0AAW0G9G1_9APHY